MRFILPLLLAVMLTACGGGDPEDTGREQAPTPAVREAAK